MLRIATEAAVLCLSAACLLIPGHQPEVALASSSEMPAPTASADACAFPTVEKAKKMSDAEIAWRLFIAAACPVENDPNAMVRWETWQNQYQVFPQTSQPGAPPPSRFHPSVLQHMMTSGSKLKELDLSNPGCSPGKNPAYPGGPTRIICEEVRLNPEAVEYITGNALRTLANQGKFVQKGGTFDFPPTAIEVKIDWVQQDGMALCNHPPTTVHVEEAIDPKTKSTRCYALAGIHIGSKLAHNWIWATWEPQNNTVNPRRCFELGCDDPWGAVPSELPANQQSPPNSGQTPQLALLMKEARLSPEWYNYRLDGVQSAYSKRDRPTLLGNSVTEAEAVGLDLHQASCITCHASSSVNSRGADGFALLLGPPKIRPIGNPDKYPPTNNPGYVRRDFSWVFTVAKPAPVESPH